MIAQFFTLLTHPDRAWVEIRKDEEAHSTHHLVYLFILALLPPLCMFIGTTQVGWSLVEGETVKLDARSALALSVLIYLTIVIGAFIMGGFLRWMSRSFAARPTFNQCVGFVAYLCTPFYISGIGALYPNRWVAITVLVLAGIYATYLLYVGLPKFMRLDSGRSFLFASCAWGVGLLVLVNIKVAMVLVWQLGFQPTYERTAIQDQAYPSRAERPQKVPEGL